MCTSNLVPESSRTIDLEVEFILLVLLLLKLRYYCCCVFDHITCTTSLLQSVRFSYNNVLLSLLLLSIDQLTAFIPYAV
jgi:hypothetical protein